MHLVLYFNEFTCEAYSFKQGSLVNQKTLNESELSAFIQEQKNSTRVSLILDTSEETIQTENVPSLLPWEKPTLQKRLTEKNKQKGAVAQRFIWTGLKQQTAEGRRQELLVTHLLTPLEPLASLIKLIQDQRLVWIGCYSTAYLIQNFLNKKLKPIEGLSAKQLKQPILIFAKMSSTHYRQGFIHEGVLQLTRLIPFDSDQNNPNRQVEFLLNEARLAARFIYNQGLLSRDKPISYVIVDSLSQDSESSITSQFIEEGLYNTAQSGSKQFLVTYSLERNENGMKTCVPLLIDQVKKGFMPSFYSIFYIQLSNGFRFSRAFFSLIAFMATFALVMASMNAGLQHYFLDQKAELLLKTEAILDDKKTMLLKQARGRESVVDMDAIVNFSSTLNKLNQNESYSIDLNAVSNVLQQHPNIKVEVLSWQPDGHIDSQFMNVTMRGQVYPFEGSFKIMNELLDQFVDQLSGLEAVKKVKITQHPYTDQQARQFRVTQVEANAGLPFAVGWQQVRRMPDIESRIEYNAN